MSFLANLFSDTTLSLHFKAMTPLRTKEGTPGFIEVVTHDDDVRDTDRLTGLLDVINTEMYQNPHSFVEIRKPHFDVIQHGIYRIVVVKPPLADALEVTIVRPLTKLSLEDYALSEAQRHHLLNNARGLLVSGAPGSGKSTFVQGLGDHFSAQGKIIKTIESPRDLQVADNVVQYSYNHASHNDIRDILLLSRPDISLYDEVRNREDFQLFKDLRLTGIGLIGVIHATKAIDSIQRFLGTIEMGVIPQVVDTVVFMDKGAIHTIYTLQLVVKVPDGMMSEDLARPVVVISNFDTGTPAYEIYTYGEQLVVLPLGGPGANKAKMSGLAKLAMASVQDFFAQELDFQHFVTIQGQTVLLYIADDHKGRVIGKGGERIALYERKLGLSISVKDVSEIPLFVPEYTLIDVSKSQLSYQLPMEYAGKRITCFIGNHVEERWVDERGHLIFGEKYLIRKIEKSGRKMLQE